MRQKARKPLAKNRNNPYPIWFSIKPLQSKCLGPPLKETVDRYKRTVGTLFVDGLDVNREQVRKGKTDRHSQGLVRGAGHYVTGIAKV